MCLRKLGSSRDVVLKLLFLFQKRMAVAKILFFQLFLLVPLFKANLHKKKLINTNSLSFKISVTE